MILVKEIIAHDGTVIGKWNNHYGHATGQVTNETWIETESPG
jgi:hypothetical protein